MRRLQTGRMRLKATVTIVGSQDSDGDRAYTSTPTRKVRQTLVRRLDLSERFCQYRGWRRSLEFRTSYDVLR